MSDATLHGIANRLAPLAGRLRALRAGIATWFLVDGLKRLLAAGAVLAIVDLPLDWCFRWDLPQRASLLALATAVLAYVAWRRIAMPLSRSLGDDALCLAVERRHPQLGESLISALQFARWEGEDIAGRGVSPAMARAAIEQGLRAAESVDFGSVLDRRRLRVNAAWLAALVAVYAAVGWGVASTDFLGTWFERNVLLREHPWPQRTYLVVVGAHEGSLIVPRGDDWEQIVEITPASELPAALHVDSYTSRGRYTEEVPTLGRRRVPHVFRTVNEPFQFRVRGGDARSPWINVSLVDRPSVAQLSLQATEPRYAGGRTRELASGVGPYALLTGSRLAVIGTANKPLASAVLRVGEKAWPLVVRGDQFAGALEPADVLPGVYEIALEDNNEPVSLASKPHARFTIEERPDREPTVRASLAGIGGMVVPRAVLPIEVRASDDFVVTGVELVHRWRGAEASTAVVEGRVVPDAAAPLVGRDRLAFAYRLDLAPLAIPVGSGLSLQVEARDNDDVSGPKTGASPELLLRVVSEEELRADLLRREKEQRQEFEQLLKNQEELLTATEVLLAQVRGHAAIAEPHREVLMTSQKRQRLASTNLAGMARRLESIVVEVGNNRLEEAGGPIQRRLLDEIIGPLMSLADERVPAASQQLDRARRLAAEGSERDEALAAAVAEQRQIVAAMKSILAHMVQSESYQEAINLLYQVERSQQEVFDQTLKELEERIRRILQPGGAPPPMEKPSPEPNKPGSTSN
jgi:hypothetical protein